jgi:hypothetical protein
MHGTRQQLEHKRHWLAGLHASSSCSRSLFVIGLILAILIVGLRYFFAAGQSTKQSAAVAQMKQAVADFRSKFGYLPPLGDGSVCGIRRRCRGIRRRPNLARAECEECQ